MRSLRRALHYFEQVGRTKSVRAASLALHVAPSAVSRAVQQLEHEIGTPLFDRTVNGLQLTAAGQIVLTYAQRWERESEQLADALRSLSGLQLQVLRIACVEVASYDLVPSAVAEVQRRVQGVQLQLNVGNAKTVLESIANGAADIGLVINLPKSAPGRTEWTVHNPIGVVLPSGHRLAHRKSVRLEECVSDPVVLPDEGLIAHSAVRAALESLGRFQIAATCNRIVAIKSLVRAGLGISFLTWFDVAMEHEAGEFRFVPLEGPLIEQPYVSVVTARTAKKSAVVDLFLETLREAMPTTEFTA
ncbi:HTH-type transcriptional activator CmpR [Ralstonia psammae]|uniref:HTH-type transcriptional activator CmpR n=1 Tax=Ralstonia psammae TaxID=3058598 RepID=A0ABM9JYL4_9RALS|nr:LysR family transcriptional regulator [Ralstonia sp. LMG 19083]CAJ0808625.1 HTH-type transcriptional activator CmpR [Ralstonia sp. LMG 19083]